MNYLSIILGILIMYVALKIYQESDYVHLKCIISGVDGNKYCVRHRNKLHLAADKLAKVTENMRTLVKFAGKKYGNNDAIKRLVEGFNPKKIVETLPTSKYTAYSQNKGEKMAFCLNKKKDSDELIDLNTLTFVAIHELAHVATKSVGHTDEFWQNFKFLLQIANKLNIYEPIDYSKKPKEYCGMTINDNPYYE